MGWRLIESFVIVDMPYRCSKPAGWDGDFTSSKVIGRTFTVRSEPTAWDGDSSSLIRSWKTIRTSFPSPPCGIATGTPIFANAPCGVENLELKEKSLNF